jgi:hypothetical protein
MVRTFLKVYMELQLRYEKNQYHNIVMGHGLGNLVFICFNPDRNGDMQSKLTLQAGQRNDH